MDARELRALQAPLKRRYRDEPESARTEVAASGDLASPGVTAVVQGWAGRVRAGLHPATGGSGDDACSADMLLQALLACAGVTMRSVAVATGVSIRDGALAAEGYFDARGTLGVDRAAAVGLTGVVITATLDTDADDAALERLTHLAERYCVVGQSLRDPPRFVVTRR